MQQQYCHSCDCSAVYHAATGNEKWSKQKSADNIFGNKLWFIIHPFTTMVLVEGCGF